MIIDAHAHVWDLDRAEYPWLTPDLGPLHATRTLAELESTMERLGIDACVLVQAADNGDDTAHLQATADQHRSVAAIVGWAPLDRPAQLPDRLRELRSDPRVVGVRNLIHDREPGWLEGEAQDEALGLLSEADLTLDFVTAGPDALGELPGIGRRHPDLRIVIDHLGKPPIGGSADDRKRWRTLLAAGAANPLTHAKISGLHPTVGDPASWTVDSVRPFVEDAVELFGPRRLMFGGDWPMVTRAGGYERAWEAFRLVIAGLAAAERFEICGGTAVRFYRIPMEGLI